MGPHPAAAYRPQQGCAVTADSAPIRLGRLLTLVPWLVRHDGVTIKEAAEHFGVSEQELEKDLWLLIVCGLPGYGPDQLVDIQFWDDGVIHVLDPLTLNRPLRLTADEATSLLVAMRVLAQIVPPSRALMSASERLAEVTMNRASVGLVPEVVIDAGTTADVLACVSTALMESRTLEITYAGATRDEVTRRVIEPAALESIDGRSTVLAFCRTAEAMRSFRVDRILAATLGERFEPDGPNRENYEGLAARSSDAFTCSLLLDAEVRWAVDVHGMTITREFPDGGVEASMVVHDPGWIVRLVMTLRGHAELIAPQELRPVIAAAASDGLRAMSGESHP